MKWVGSRGQLRQRRLSLLPKSDPYPQGDVFINTIFLPAKALVVSSMQGGPHYRGHPAFSPPEGSVKEDDFEEEYLEQKRMFVLLRVFQTEIGPVRDKDIHIRKVPDLGEQKGIMMKYDKEKEDCFGYYLVRSKVGKRLALEKKHHDGADSVHQGQSQAILDQVRDAMVEGGSLGAGVSSDSGGVRSIGDWRLESEKIQLEGGSGADQDCQMSVAPAPPVMGALELGDESEDHPLAYLKSKVYSRKKKSRGTPESPLKKAEAGKIQNEVRRHNAAEKSS